MAVEPTDQSWWSVKEPAERARIAYEWCRRLEQKYGGEQRDREATFRDLYEGQWAPPEAAMATVVNVVQQVVDSKCSDITRDRVRVQFQTSKADWEAQERAIQIGNVVEADFAEAGLYGDEAIELCRDGLCIGEGVIKATIDYESQRVLLERVRSSRIFADARDARLGKPRCWGYFESYPPELLKARFPKHAEAIDEADDVGIDIQQADAREENRNPGEEFTKRVMVYEVWHLPSQRVQDTSDDKEWEDGAKHDGRHMLLIGTKVAEGTPLALVDEPWAIQRPLFVLYRPARRMTGWHGQSWAERLQSTQHEINMWQARATLIMKLHSILRLVVDRKSKLEPSKLTNDFASILEVDGDPRSAILALATDTVPPELFRRIESLEQKARDYSGKSELTMMGKKPPGIESGIALEHLIDQDSIRNNPEYKRWEECMVALAELDVECHQLLASRVDGYEARWSSQSNFGKVKFSSISLDRDRYKVRAQGRNLLPSTPAAQIDAAVQLVDKGILPPSQLSRIFGDQYADIAELTAPESAAMNAVQSKLARIVREKRITKESLPEEFNDLALFHRLAIAKVNEAEAADIKDTAVLVALKQAAAMAQTKLAAIQPAAPAATVAGGQPVQPLPVPPGAPPTGPTATPPPEAAPPPTPGMAA